MQNLFLVDIEDEPDLIESQNSSKNRDIKQLLNQKTNKFANNTLTKGFFNGDQDQYDLEESNSKRQIEDRADDSRKQKEKSDKRHNSRKQPIKLKPLQQKREVEVFQNVASHNNPYDNFNETSQKNREQADSSNFNQVQRDYPQKGIKRAHRKKTNRRQSQKPQETQQKQQLIQIPQANTVDRLYFYQQQVQITQSPKKIDVDIPINRIANQVFHDSDQQTIQMPVQQQSSPQQERILAQSQYFRYHQPNLYKRQLFEPVKQNNILRMEIIRDKGGFNTFWPQFHMHFSHDCHHVMSAKRTSSKPTSTFIISTDRTNFQQTSQFYLGKMKSNILGDVLNIFGPGLNPDNAKDKKIIPRELIATVVYMSNLFQMGKPRQFIVYVKRPEYKYYNAFDQVMMYDEQIPLNKLYQNPKNINKIAVFRNRKPIWMEQINGYMLNFRGRVQCPSIKNFILQQKTNGPDLMIFGKVTQSKFNIDVYHPMNPYLAFAIALASFDSRIMCE